MTTIESGECIGSGKNSVSQEEFAEDSLKNVSLLPVENNDSVEEMISPKKEVKSSPFTSVSEKDGKIIQSDSVEVSFSETSLEETEAIKVECPGVVSLPESGSTVLEENKVGEELQQIEISREGDQSGDDVHKIEDVAETDGCVVSISDMEKSLNSEKKGQDSDVQMLLEAEKKRLLAEIEGGSIFKKKDDVETLARVSDFPKIEKNGKGSKDLHQKVERVSVKDNAFVGRSVKIDLVDDTALFDVVPFYKKGKTHPKRLGTAHTDKDAPRKYKKVAEVKTIEKGNASSIVESYASTEVSDFRIRRETNGKIMYSRNQMESLRYAHIEDQKNMWSDMYARLQPELVTEYQGLVGLKNHKSSKSYPRESGISILGTKEGIEEEEDYVVKEEYIEDNDDYNSILRPAFAVDGEPDFDSGPPEDGLEYLRRVRWEAKGIPNVNVAKIDERKYIKKEQSVYMPQIPEIPKCPQHLLPVKEWEDSLLSDFSHLRLALSQTDNTCEDEVMSSQSVDEALMEIFNKRLHTDSDESLGGVVSEIQEMDSVTRVSKLRKQICLVEKESGLKSNDCKWVVALCASVDTPLDADSSACLRALLRKCASLRASEVEDERVITMANMLITIAGKYFGQME